MLVTTTAGILQDDYCVNHRFPSLLRPLRPSLEPQHLLPAVRILVQVGPIPRLPYPITRQSSKEVKRRRGCSMKAEELLEKRHIGGLKVIRK
jgi:hypothetical protein